MLFIRVYNTRRPFYTKRPSSKLVNRLMKVGVFQTLVTFTVQSVLLLLSVELFHSRGRIFYTNLISTSWKPHESASYQSPHSSSSSSVGATTLGGFWPALRFCSTIFYLYTSLSSFSLSSSLNPLLIGQAISVLVFRLVLMNMVPIQ